MTASAVATACRSALGDTLRGNPRQSLPDPVPQVVVAAAGQRRAGTDPQLRIGGQDRAACGGVFGQAGGQVQADRLPPQRSTLLP